MGKAPAFQFYVMDWSRDLEEHPLEIEGAWIRICCKLHWTAGELTKTHEQWARILRVDLGKTNEILGYLQQEGICDIVTDDNKKVTVISRRMKKEYKDKKNGALRQAKYRESQQSNKRVTPPSSSSSSPSKKKKGFQPPKKSVLEPDILESTKLAEQRLKNYKSKEEKTEERTWGEK